MIEKIGWPISCEGTWFSKITTKRYMLSLEITETKKGQLVNRLELGLYLDESVFSNK